MLEEVLDEPVGADVRHRTSSVPVALTKALLPSMRRGRARPHHPGVQRAAGVRGMPATAPYSAVKGALERWGEVDGR